MVRTGISFNIASGMTPMPQSVISRPYDPTVRDYDRVYGGILSAALKSRTTNRDFFCAASEMLLPQRDFNFHADLNTPFRSVVAVAQKNPDDRQKVESYVGAMEKGLKYGDMSLALDLKKDGEKLVSLYRAGYPACAPVIAANGPAPAPF